MTEKIKSLGCSGNSLGFWITFLKKISEHSSFPVLALRQFKASANDADIILVGINLCSGY